MSSKDAIVELIKLILLEAIVPLLHWNFYMIQIGPLRFQYSCEFAVECFRFSSCNKTAEDQLPVFTWPIHSSRLGKALEQLQSFCYVVTLYLPESSYRSM